MSELVSIEVIKEDLLRNISEKYNIDYNNLLIDLEQLSITKTVKSKYFCNHNFFNEDSEQSFYWAGFIAADGCVFSKNLNIKKIIISLSDKDEEHLFKFKSNINFTGPISKSTTKRINKKWKDSTKCTITISSYKLFDSLKRFNIVPNKTNILTFPNHLKEHPLINHFMRGYVDGDGSFYINKNRRRVCFELRGTYGFLKDYQHILENNLNKRTKVKITIPDSTSKIKYSGIKIMPSLVDFLYKDATIFMERKYNIAKKCYIRDSI